MQLEVIRATEFVRFGAEGRFDLPASKAALAEIARACHKRAIHDAVLDLRLLRPKPKPMFSPDDLAELLNTFPEIGFSTRFRLAVLYRIDPHRRARLFAFLGKLRGWNIETFENFEQALRWLSTPRSRREFTAGKSVRIKFASPASKVRKRPSSQHSTA